MYNASTLPIGSVCHPGWLLLTPFPLVAVPTVGEHPSPCRSDSATAANWLWVWSVLFPSRVFIPWSQKSLIDFYESCNSLAITSHHRQEAIIASQRATGILLTVLSTRVKKRLNEIDLEYNIYVDFIRMSLNHFRKSSRGNLCAEKPWIIHGSKASENF